MTDPNTGGPAGLTVPELLEGLGHLGTEAHDMNGESAPGDVLHLLRRLADHAERTSAYGQQLWQQLSAVVAYLREDVVRADAGGALDEDARRRWADVYGSTLSLLAGPHGDSGYGGQQAQLELQNLDGRARHDGATAS